MVNILLVEDDKDLNQIICKHLNTHGYQVMGCLNVSEAYGRLYANHIDMIISDIMMKGIDGFEFAETVRKQDKNIPILFVTAKEDFGSKERGYRIGIDERLVIGDLVLDEEAVSAKIAGEEVTVTLREFQILYKLLSYPGRTFTRSQLMDEFEGIEKETGLRTVDVHIAGLRSKFSVCGGLKIVTVHGMGYKAVIL